MREFLMGLYIEHGDRSFKMFFEAPQLLNQCIRNGFIDEAPDGIVDEQGWISFVITPKAIEYIKKLDNP